MSEKYVVTWDMFQMHARKLAERLLPATQWKGIISKPWWFIPSSGTCSRIKYSFRGNRVYCQL